MYILYQVGTTVSNLPDQAGYHCNNCVRQYTPVPSKVLHVLDRHALYQADITELPGKHALVISRYYSNNCQAPIPSTKLVSARQAQL